MPFNWNLGTSISAYPILEAELTSSPLEALNRLPFRINVTSSGIKSALITTCLQLISLMYLTQYVVLVVTPTTPVALLPSVKVNVVQSSDPGNAYQPIIPCPIKSAGVPLTSIVFAAVTVICSSSKVVPSGVTLEPTFIAI